VDLEVKHLAVTSDEEYLDHPKYLRKSERKLKWLQRMVSRGMKGFNRWIKAVAMLDKCHEYIDNQRKDAAHKSADTWWTTTIGSPSKTWVLGG
jgi:putative transposase